MIKVIMTADDLGMSRVFNGKILDLVRREVVLSTVSRGCPKQ